MKKVVKYPLVILGGISVAAAVGLFAAWRASRNINLIDYRGWREVETEDDPREFCADEGTGIFSLGLGTKPARRI